MQEIPGIGIPGEIHHGEVDLRGMEGIQEEETNQEEGELTFKKLTEKMKGKRKTSFHPLKGKKHLKKSREESLLLGKFLELEESL